MTTKPGLLVLIRAVISDAGVGLKGNALTDLTHSQGGNQIEHGFQFLRLCGGLAVFAVPPQDRQKWSRQKGWPCPEKEMVARSIAQKPGLELSEPPDVKILVGGEAYHRCAFHRAGQTLIEAHPRYLKTLVPERPVIPEEALLEGLATRYTPTEQC